MKLKVFTKENVNVPNVLSLLRLLLVPVYVVLFVGGHKYAALAVFAAASLTDLLDGYIARKYHLITDLGKLLDPLADKVMVLTALFSMAIGSSAIPPVIPWVAVWVVLGKEVLMLLGGMLMLKRGVVVHSLMIGKTAHTVFIIGLISSYFHDSLEKLCVGWPMTLDLIFIWLAVVLTLIALAVYATHCVQALREKRAFR